MANRAEPPPDKALDELCVSSVPLPAMVLTSESPFDDREPPPSDFATLKPAFGVLPAEVLAPVTANHRLMKLARLTEAVLTTPPALLVAKPTVGVVLPPV